MNPKVNLPQKTKKLFFFKLQKVYCISSIGYRREPLQKQKYWVGLEVRSLL